MRTTLTVDDDLAALLKKRAKQLGISFKDMVNRAIRTGLGEIAAHKPRKRVVVEPFKLELRPGIDPNKLGQLADELEDEALIEKMMKGS